MASVLITSPRSPPLWISRGDVFQQCVQSERYKRRVEEDVREADRLGVQVTPTLFVNGKSISGSVSLETLSARVEQALQ